MRFLFALLFLLSFAFGCSRAAADAGACEYCGQTGGEHAVVVRTPEWLDEWGDRDAALTALAEQGIQEGALRTWHTCPRSLGELPPEGWVRVLPPVQTRDETDHVSWNWTIVSRRLFANSTLRSGAVMLYGHEEPDVAGNTQDYVWSFRLSVDGQQQEAGYVMRYQQELQPLNGRWTGTVGQSELAPLDHDIHSLVAVTDASLLVKIPGNAILGTVDGNAIQLFLSEEKPEGAPALRLPWMERIKERIYAQREVIKYRD